ncbi:hypothetical protein MUK42_37430 [Musa troglodytarum]|uniref:Uncharacterized protein n=1 Tax=Musa troglodytarum TaxID=320322 RepID=A0A9E7FSP7_9LILI|nr:hypothetical protein MUK42_37430 [Musa troglodytarum]
MAGHWHDLGIVWIHHSVPWLLVNTSDIFTKDPYNWLVTPTAICFIEAIESQYNWSTKFLQMHAQHMEFLCAYSSQLKLQTM